MPPKLFLNIDAFDFSEIKNQKHFLITPVLSKIILENYNLEIYHIKLLEANNELVGKIIGINWTDNSKFVELDLSKNNFNANESSLYNVAFQSTELLTDISFFIYRTDGTVLQLDNIEISAN